MRTSRLPKLMAAESAMAVPLALSRLQGHERRGGAPVRRLDPDAEVEEAHADCMRRLEEFRDAWAGEHDVEDSTLYLFFPGGFWTETFLGKVSDCAMAKARGHTQRFCLLFSWPKVKSCTFGAHGEAAAVQLAKEWCR